MRAWVIAGAAAAVAAVLLVGAWLLLGGRGEVRAGTGPAGTAPTTLLSWSPDPSDGSRPPDPYPTVPSAQIRDEYDSSSVARTGNGGRRLLIRVFDSDCSSERVRLLGEHTDRVEVEIRTVAKPLPPGASVAPDGSYGCVSYSALDGPHAVIDLDAPLGERAVVIHRERR